MPVTYCLHMLKFSAKFNSQTGNFEITANFIGYTYAMLSDMLLGYLKAVPYTNLGKDKYDELRDPSKGGNPSLLTLNELMKKISEIDIKSQKIKSTDPNYADLVNGEAKKGQLDAIKSNIFILGQTIDIKKDLDEYKYILVQSKPSTKEGTDQSDGITKYNTNVTAAIKEYNTNNSLTITDTDFTSITQKKYSGISLRLLALQKDLDTQLVGGKTYEEQKIPTLQKKGLPSDMKEFEEVRTTLLKHITKNYEFDPKYEFDVYDLKKLYDIIQTKSDDIVKQQKTLQKTLGDTLRAEVTKTLGFDPTVRNIINVFINGC